jgi:hypothetical protein
MPYITKERREAIETLHQGIRFDRIQNAGELNYTITRLIDIYTKSRGRNYQTINDVSGALTEALAEYRRRITVPYENYKLSLNGDAYGEGSAFEEAEDAKT